MTMSFRQVRAFVAVAETGSFSQAAKQLFLTQSALSGLIKELEQSLNCKLFDRTTRQVTLSNMGERLLPQAKRVLNELNLLEIEAKNLTNLEQGQVRLAVSQQFAASAMPDIIAQFREQFPSIHISLLDGSVEAVLKSLQNGEVDLGIGAERAYDNNIQAEYLFELPFYAVLPEHHPLTKFEQVPWVELENQSLITLAGPFTQKLYEDLPHDIANRILTSSYEVNLMSTALGMTIKNLGVTVCLPYAAAWVKQQNLQMRLLIEPVISRQFFIYQQRNRALSPAVTTFKNFLKTRSYG